MYSSLQFYEWEQVKLIHLVGGCESICMPRRCHIILIIIHRPEQTVS